MGVVRWSIVSSQIVSRTGAVGFGDERGMRRPTDYLTADYLTSSHTSPFTRRLPARVMPMHVSRSPVFPRTIGRGTKPCHVSNDCLAAADKTRSRAPFGGFSRATPVPLHPGALAFCSRSFRQQPASPISAFRRKPSGSPIPICSWTYDASQARPGLFQPGGGPFSARARWQGFASSPHHQHRPRLDASPCVVAVAGQEDCRMGFGVGENLV